MVKPEITLCETVLNLSTLNTLTYLLTNSLTSLASISTDRTSYDFTNNHMLPPGPRFFGKMVGGREWKRKIIKIFATRYHILRL